MPDEKNKDNKVAAPEDIYDGLDKPVPYLNANSNATKTVTGGAFWVNGVLKNAEGVALDRDGIAAFKQHRKDFPIA